MINLTANACRNPLTILIGSVNESILVKSKVYSFNYFYVF